MKTKKIRIFLLSVLILILLLLSGYLGVSFYYSRGFAYGTWINGIYSTGSSVAEVNEQLISGTKLQDLQITDSYGNISVITAESVRYEVDYSGQLRKIKRSQNPYLWINDLSAQRQETVSPEYSIDRELLRQEILKSSVAVRSSMQKQEVKIYRENNGYELYNGMEHVLNVEKLVELAEEAFLQGKTELDLSGSDCYEDLPLTEEMRETVALYEKIADFQQCGVVYDMGDAMISISPDITADWITLNQDGTFALDERNRLILREEGIVEFIDRLAEEYDTYGSTRTFQATRGETVQIEGGTYGNRLDRQEEVRYLTDAFINGISETHIPAYDKVSLVRGREDIGDTYIEIDMTAQKMYYYEDGEMVIETDVVTGNVKRKNATPSGVNYVYNKQRNRILRGEGYASKVKYWMPVKGNIGIHDASWRKEFGGEIYLKNGSHGCINTPSDVMAKLYEVVQVGTPVVMFY